MSRHFQIPVLLVALLLPLLRADMITNREDHASVNGKVVEMANDEIILVARFAAGEQRLKVKMADLELIEFGDTDFNSGPPEKVLGFGPPVGAPKPNGSKSNSKAPAGPGDIVVLKKGARPQPGCKVTSIDAHYVHCSGKDFDRTEILRILVLAPR